MSLLLHIDTSIETGSISISQDEQVIASSCNENRNDQAAWIHTAIRELLHQAGMQLQHLQAISISIGPGSYTGLRIGLATAKGLCYALNIPLITIPTLQMIAHAAAREPGDLIISMIDARRMEVYAAAYDKEFRERMPATAIILDQHSFAAQLKQNRVVFCGPGAIKFQQLSPDCNAVFSASIAQSTDLIQFALNKFEKQDFASLSYVEPFYLKEFYSSSH